MNQNLKTIILTSGICTIFITGSYLHAEWSNPTVDPPAGNVAPPINTSSSNQFKEGDGRIGADQMVAFDRMRSDLYCDLDGENCFSAQDVQAAIDGSDGAPGSSDLDLVNGLHSSQQCENLGGEVMTDDGGNRFCRFGVQESSCEGLTGLSYSFCPTCPSGWFRYENWQTTEQRTCGTRNCDQCTTGADPWSNTEAATCVYRAMAEYTNADGDTYLRCGGSMNSTNTCTARRVEVGCY